MISIHVADKPQTGRFDRICKACGDSYFGFNMYICQDCERSRRFKIVEDWYNG